MRNLEMPPEAHVLRPKSHVLSQFTTHYVMN